MKKLGKILSIVLLLVLFACPISYAAGLELVSSYPKDGDGGFEPINMMVKLQFNDNVGAESVQTINEKAFKVVDQDNKSIEFKVLFTPDDNTKISLLMNGDLKSNTDYKVTLLKSLSTAEGLTLGADKTITFKTRDVGKDSTISTVMMFVMIGGMVAYTTWDTKRKAEKESMAKGDKVNPYKVAKEKGVSVEKAVEQTEKKRDKAVKQSGGSTKPKPKPGKGAFKPTNSSSKKK
jgi:hypothetical protein